MEIKTKYNIEIWKNIDDFPDYQVSNWGQVRSLKGGKSRLLKGSSNDSYPAIQLRRGIKFYRRTIHRLVAIAFIPNPKNLPVVNHLDFDRANNKIENLEWCTTQENVQHAYSNGHRSGKVFRKGTNSQKGLVVGENSPRSKLSDKQVIEIKELYINTRLSQKEIAQRYSTSQANISLIIHGRNWRHLGGNIRIPMNTISIVEAIERL